MNRQPSCKSPESSLRLGAKCWPRVHIKSDRPPRFSSHTCNATSSHSSQQQHHHHHHQRMVVNYESSPKHFSNPALSLLHTVSRLCSTLSLTQAPTDFQPDPSPGRVCARCTARTTPRKRQHRPKSRTGATRSVFRKTEAS